MPPCAIAQPAQDNCYNTNRGSDQDDDELLPEQRTQDQERRRAGEKKRRSHTQHTRARDNGTPRNNRLKFRRTRKRRPTLQNELRKRKGHNYIRTRKYNKIPIKCPPSRLYDNIQNLMYYVTNYIFCQTRYGSRGKTIRGRTFIINKNEHFKRILSCFCAKLKIIRSTNFTAVLSFTLRRLFLTSTEPSQGDLGFTNNCHGQ